MLISGVAGQKLPQITQLLRNSSKRDPKWLNFFGYGFLAGMGLTMKNMFLTKFLEF
jgi:hypothetical protein